jgi:hypothetical protein
LLDKGSVAGLGDPQYFVEVAGSVDLSHFAEVAGLVDPPYFAKAADHSHLELVGY